MIAEWCSSYYRSLSDRYPGSGMDWASGYQPEKELRHLGTLTHLTGSKGVSASVAEVRSSKH